MKKTAVVLLSGGQDSSTCLYWTKERFKKVYAIGFYYGQKHKKELEQAQKICGLVGVEYKIFDVTGLAGKSSLNNGGDHNEKSQTNKELPASFLPGRNILFLSIAASFCGTVGSTDIITGVCQTDYSGYPDCRKVTVSALENTLSLGMGMGDFIIHTPLMYLTKAETWRMAKELGCLEVIIKETVTDYNGDMTENEWGFGKADNPASVLRKNGFYEAKQNGWI